MENEGKSLRFRGECFQKLQRHLLGNPHGSEEAAFLFADWMPDAQTGAVKKCRYLEDKEFEYQSRYGLELAEGVLDDVIKQAHDLEMSLVEVHSHPFHSEGGAEFSSSDWTGFQEVVAHILWRLPNRPYFALVFAPDGFDGLVWLNSDDDPESLSSILLKNDEKLAADQSRQGRG